MLTASPEPLSSPRFLEKYSLFVFKQRLVETRLADNALESATPEGVVDRHGDGDGCALRLQLHDTVTAALAHGDKTAPF